MLKSYKMLIFVPSKGLLFLLGEEKPYLGIVLLCISEEPGDIARILLYHLEDTLAHTLALGEPSTAIKIQHHPSTREDRLRGVRRRTRFLNLECVELRQDLLQEVVCGVSAVCHVEQACNRFRASQAMTDAILPKPLVEDTRD